MSEILTSSIQLHREDFEFEAARVGTKIQTYFAQLIEVIKHRQNQLISELDAILSSYRLEKDRLEYLEKLRDAESENCRDLDVDEIQYDILYNIESELEELQQKISKFVEFEWNRKYAREASAIGKLTVKSLVTMSAESLEGSFPGDKISCTPERKPRTYSHGDDVFRPNLDVAESPVFNTDRSTSSYKGSVDITPERFRRVLIDNSSPIPYNPGHTQSAPKRICLEGNLVPGYRADSAEHVVVTKFDADL